LYDNFNGTFKTETILIEIWIVIKLKAYNHWCDNNNNSNNIKAIIFLPVEEIILQMCVVPSRVYNKIGQN
jgi:hypothetical protein